MKFAWLNPVRKRSVRRRARRTKTSNTHFIIHKETARLLIHERLTHWNSFYQFTYNRVAIRNQGTRWGSCSTKSNLNFNYRLLFLPIELVDYVIVHELCHLKHFNHGHEFWASVAEHIPDYQKRKNELQAQAQVFFWTSSHSSTSAHFPTIWYSSVMNEIADIVLIDKPKGITSFDVIRRLRKELGIRKMGHGGTLDPLATGLMIIGIEKGTKKLATYIKLPKEYVAEIRVGEKRTTGDLEGEIIEEMEVTSLDEDRVKKILTTMLGTLALPVSAYSAIKKDGVPMYKRARKAEETGEVVDDIPIRTMQVFESELQSISCAENRCVLTVRFYVGSGTYIRSLGEELGKRLGYPATLQNLRRTKIGEFDIKDAREIK